MNNDFVSIRGLTLPRRMILQGHRCLATPLGMLFAAVHESVRGTTRTSRSGELRSVHWGEAEAFIQPVC